MLSLDKRQSPVSRTLAQRGYRRSPAGQHLLEMQSGDVGAIDADRVELIRADGAKERSFQIQTRGQLPIWTLRDRQLAKNRPDWYTHPYVAAADRRRCSSPGCQAER